MGRLYALSLHRAAPGGPEAAQAPPLRAASPPRGCAASTAAGVRPVTATESPCSDARATENLLATLCQCDLNYRIPDFPLYVPLLYNSLCSSRLCGTAFFSTIDIVIL